MSDNTLTLEGYPDLMTVKEVADVLRTTPKTIYVYLSNSGAKGGRKHKRFPEGIRIKIGTDKVLFLKEKLIEWLNNGAKLVS